MNQEEIEFFKEVEALLIHNNTEIEYRLHYNDDGEIYACSMCDHPESEKYLVVTAHEYENYFRYRVVKDALIEKTIDAGYRARLQRSENGFRAVKNHASVLLEEQEEFSTIEHYAPTNN
jgi:hypothetical protein